MESQGEIIQDEEHIRVRMQEHFKNIFIDKAALRWSGRILNHENQSMIEIEKLTEINKPFSEKEIKIAIWGLEPDKSSGPDGFLIFLLS